MQFTTRVRAARRIFSFYAREKLKSEFLFTHALALSVDAINKNLMTQQVQQNRGYGRSCSGANELCGGWARGPSRPDPGVRPQVLLFARVLRGGEEDWPRAVQCRVPGQEHGGREGGSAQKDPGMYPFLGCSYEPFCVSFSQIFDMVDAKARQDCIKEIELLKVRVGGVLRRAVQVCSMSLSSN